MEDETKNGSELLVRVPSDTKKRLSYTIKQFSKLVEERLESLSITPEQIAIWSIGPNQKILFLKL